MNLTEELMKIEINLEKSFDSKRYEPPVREAYYLNHWIRYKKNLNDLDYTGIQQARLLFRSLKELSAEDREFLAMKYDPPSPNTTRITDEAMAKKLGMTLHEYRVKRRLIQKRLKKIMVKHKIEAQKNN
ncbi:hypothetical protein [Marinilactibacillus psychrotolerans]|uniref:hypothetical protein n=1 Tax=Marinilactibacillus psychrotolerans TaxID=191770 RepID=UPI00388B25CD